MQHIERYFLQKGKRNKDSEIRDRRKQKTIEIKIMREREGEGMDVGARARSVPVKESKTHSYKICKHCQKLFMSDAPQNAQRLKYTVRGAQKMLFPPAPGSSKNITSLLKNIHN